MTEVLSEIYEICDLHNHHSSDSTPSDAAKCKAIINLLTHNLKPNNEINIPKNIDKWSFMTSVKHQRNKNSDLTLKDVLGDGERAYHQYQKNKNTEFLISDFRHKFAFTNYDKNIPKQKLIKTKNGLSYNIDDLVTMVIHRNSFNEPRDMNNRLYLWESELEENKIIGHPGLSDELREKYLLHKKYKIDKEKSMYEMLCTNMKILDSIGEYGIMFLNVALSTEKYKHMLQNLINIIGNSEENPILQYEVIPSKTLFSIIQENLEKKHSPQELGYYFILIYLKFYNICHIKQNHDLLPIFRNYSSKCNTTVYCGTIVNPLIDTIDCSTQTTETLDSLNEKSHEHKNIVFLYIPSQEPDKLIITNHTIQNNDVREDFVTSTGISLHDICPELLTLIENDNLFSNTNLLNYYQNIISKIKCRINN